MPVEATHVGAVSLPPRYRATLGRGFSVQVALLLQPDWLRKRALEAAMWAEAELSKASVIQVLKEKLLRGEPSAQLRSTVLDLLRSGPNLSEVSAVTFQRGMPSKNLYDCGQN